MPKSKKQIYGITAGLTIALLASGFFCIKKSIDSINEGYARINKKLDDIDRSLDELLKNVEELDRKVKEFNINLEENNRRLTAIEEEIERQNKFNEEFNEVLNTLGMDLEEYMLMRDSLLKVKEHLNVSPDEDTKYVNIFSIGDAVFLSSEDTEMFKDIYSLINNTDPVSSLYGNSEIRFIKEIVMTNGEVITEVDNMNDYELFLELGFTIKGYNLVNQYSLVNDELVDEGRVAENSIKLVFSNN